MNFLAHLHLARLADSSLLGNLMADFVRGNPHQHWSAPVADGILMHRRLDVMTDALPEVRTARQLFRAETYRVAPITLDVIWDHFNPSWPATGRRSPLTRRWRNFPPPPSRRSCRSCAIRPLNFSTLMR